MHIGGDKYHYIDRLMTEVKVSQHDKGMQAKKNEFRQAVKNVYIDPSIIEQNLLQVKAIFSHPSAGKIWNDEVERAYQNLLPHLKMFIASRTL